MRFYSVLLVFVFTGMAAAQEINWMSMEAALAKQKEVPKKIRATNQHQSSTTPSKTPYYTVLYNKKYNII